MPVAAGTLDDFEDDATEAAEPDSAGAQASDSGSGGSFGFAEGMLRALGHVLWEGGSASLRRMSPASPGETLGIRPRDPGEPLLPVARLDLGFQDVESDVSALDGRVELGYGPLGAAFRYTRYVERSPSDELAVTQWHVLYRMSLGERAEFDFGLGKMTMSGNATNSGSSASTPLRIRVTDSMFLLVRPTWSWIEDNSLFDCDAGICYALSHVSVSAGYRWFQCEDSALNGAFVGISAGM